MGERHVIERVPPHDKDAEQAVLGSILVDSLALAIAADKLRPEDLYLEAHRVIFAAALDLFQRHQPVDLVTLRDALGDRLEAAGGYPYLVDLAGSIPTTAHVGFYADSIAEKAARREAIRVHAESLAALYDPHSEDPITESLGKLMTVTVERGEESCHEFEGVLGDRYAEIHNAVKNPRSVLQAAFDFGLFDLDQMIRAEAGDMVVIGARPSAGKTALALQVMTHVAASKPVLFFSLEMSRRAIASRYFSLETGVSARRQFSGHLNEAELESVKTTYVNSAGLQYVIDDRPGLTVAQIAATTQRQMVKRGGPFGLVVVDHLGKVRAADSRATGHRQLAQISNDLKELGRKLNTPILVLAQLNRDVEKRGGTESEPRMSDLRESGCIEEDADVIMLLHRPDREASHSIAKVIVAKNRNGQCGKIPLVFDSARTRFACQEFTYAPA